MAAIHCLFKFGAARRGGDRFCPTLCQVIDSLIVKMVALRAMNSVVGKSVHITNYYHKNSGGISTSFNNLLAAAERHQRLIRLIVPGETESVEDVNPYARIYYVPARKSPIFDKRYRVMMPWQYMIKDSVIRRILLEERPDLIEVTDKYTLSLIGPMIRTNSFKKLGRPLLVHFSCERMDDNVGSFLTTGRLGKWFARRLIGNYTLPSFDFHIANSCYTAEEFFDSVDPQKNPRRNMRFFEFCWRYFRAPRIPLKQRVFVCPRGVDSIQFSPDRKDTAVRDEMIRLAGADKDARILLYAGRISPEKNVGLLLEMMKVLAADQSEKYHLLLAGDGPKREWFEKKAGSLVPGRVTALGHLDKDRLADFYANADVFVHPNPNEPFGIAPLEAMASGVAIVAPNSGGILTYASNDNAWLVEPTGNFFASAVTEITKNEHLRKSKVAEALDTARANTREASTDKLLSTYDRIYQDFQSRRALFTDQESPKSFRYMELVKAATTIAIICSQIDI